MNSDPTEPRRFSARRVLVTGAAAGIGAAIAGALARAGATVVLADFDAPALATRCAALAPTGAPIHAVALDVRDAASVEAAVASAWSAGGGLDGLVNCAGVYPIQPLLETSAEEFDRVLDTNLRGPFLLTAAVARRMLAAHHGGSVVNVSSTASVLARPGIAHYGASKAALNQFTRVAAVELAPFGIRVNAVLPGVIGTDRVDANARSEEGRRELDAKIARIPAGRLGSVDEVTAMVLFLLGDESSYCTGSLHTVDGGFSLGMARY